MSTQHVAFRCVYNPGDVIAGKYHVKKTLGEGSFGAVYLVEDRYRGSLFAFKILRLWDVPPETRKELEMRFSKEYKIGRIESEHLVHSLEYADVGGNPYILMEFCPGGDLTQLIGKRNTRVTRICSEILCGLDALHSKGIVHRDLKPENVLFKQSGVAALTDFGIVGDKNHRLTQINLLQRPAQVFGTYAYMAPEQAERARGGATVLPTSDIFSFGVLTYQLLTGELPFGKLESREDLDEYQKRGREYRWNEHALDNMPHADAWKRLIGTCLEPNFKKRIKTAHETLRMLPQDDGSVSRRAVSIPASHQYKPKAVTRGYRLRVLQGEEDERTYDLTYMERTGRRLFTIGRHLSNDIAVLSEHSDYMSRFHATIEQSKDKKYWIIRDGQWNPTLGQWKNSSNGTYVNSNPVGQNGYYLNLGDIITMGDITLRFENY